MAGPDVALQRTFRKNVEEKLETASVNNAGVIVSWELSESYDRVSLVCGETRFSDRVLLHLGTSLSRLLGVGKRLGLVDSSMRSFTMECYPVGGDEPLFVDDYRVE
jgi:hypothetical protein